MRQTIQSTVGASFHGTIVRTSLKQLRQVLGEPAWQDNTGEENNNFEWEMETDKGYPFTVFDWKECRSLEEDEIIEWRIGSKYYSVSLEAYQEIKNAIAKQKQYEPGN